VVRALCAARLGAVVLDDLSTGDPTRLPGHVPLLRGDVRDPVALRRAFSRYRPVGVIHLAAHKDVAESVANPLKYYRDNIDGLRVLLHAVTSYGIRHVLFSSSAAVYGTPARCPVTEDDATDPDNAYGRSKLIGEWMLRDAALTGAFTWAALRYFNVAGAAAPELRDRGNANLVPRLLRAAERGEPARIYGGDYPTPDGTAIRDYIHVTDIAEAHVAAATALVGGAASGQILNIGRGAGVSVREMVDAVGRALGRPLPFVIDPRRPGDPAEVVASAARIRSVLGWRARHDLDDIVTSATGVPAGATV